jgi:LCP family protein required for cell wall assembly
MGVAQEPQQPKKAARGPTRKVILASLLLVLVVGVWLSYRYWVSLRALGDESTNIVFIGVDTPLWDQVAGEENSGGYPLTFGQYGYTADAVFVGTIHPLRRSSHLLALPPDLVVTLPDGSEGRLKAVFAAGGVPAVESVVEKLLGIPIHYYVLIDYAGFTELVDAIGGVDVDVTTPVRYYHEGKLIFELEEGMQRLLGSEALHYVRYRRETESDLGRLERQQEFIMGLTDELCQAASFTQLPKLARYMEGLVDTNLRWEDGLRMATILLRRKALDIDVTMLPVQETEAGFLPEPDGIEEVVRDLFYNPSWQQMPSR